MRAKHILLPIAAIALLGSYSVYTETQKAKFDSEIWKSASYEDPKGVRVELLTPLMAHVLKFGMTVDDVDDLLGQGAEVRTGGDAYEIGAPHVQRYYLLQRENAETVSLVIEFSHKMRVTNFYIAGRARPLIF